MPTVVVRYKTKPERAAENQELVEKVFAELDEVSATGFAYASFRLEDGVSFVHVVVEEDAEGSVSLADLPAFQAFVDGIAGRCDEQPVAQRATVVGSHRMLGATLESAEEATMALNLNNVMLGSQDSKRLADFYSKVLGAPNANWSDEDNGWFGFQAGDGSIVIGPHSDVQGRSQQPARIMLNFSTPDVAAEFERLKALGAEVVAEPYEPGGASGMLMCTFADPDGNYFQLATPWDPQST